MQTASYCIIFYQFYKFVVFQKNLCYKIAFVCVAFNKLRARFTNDS